MSDRRLAILYRMVLPDHTCPYGVRAKQMLEEAGHEVEDRISSLARRSMRFKKRMAL